MTAHHKQTLTLFLGAFTGAAIPAIVASITMGSYMRQVDVNTKNLDAITPMVFRHDAILARNKVVSPPSATLSRYKYEPLPNLVYTEFVPDM